MKNSLDTLIHFQNSIKCFALSKLFTFNLRFNMGAMENAGCVTYSDSFIFKQEPP